MKPLEVRITRGAEKDLLERLAFLSQREGPDHATGVLVNLLEALGGLGSLPERGRVPAELQELGMGDVRQIVVAPWRLIYKLLPTRVELMVVADGRRDFQGLLIKRILRT